MSATDLFRYEELCGSRTIRVLRLHKGEQDDRTLGGPLNGYLRHVSLDDYGDVNLADRYHAISYFWGDAEPVDRIWLTETSFLPLGASASYILRHIECGKDLWIDSVCIDQSNDAEKSQQVAIMWDIFKSAEIVAVWLGGPDDNAELAMNLIFDIVHIDVAASRFVARGWTGRRPVILSKQYPDESDEYHEPSWLALAKLLDRPWFTRTWIIQEVVAGRNVVVFCGGQLLAWKDFVDVLSTIRRWHCERLLAFQNSTVRDKRLTMPRGTASIDRIEILRERVVARTGLSSLEENLLMTLQYESKDPRDKVYAISSFSLEALAPQLQPRYDLSVIDVYTNVTKFLLCERQSLKLIPLAGIGWNRNHPELPSWVPDYSHIRGESSFHVNTLARSLRGVESGDSFWTRSNIHTLKIEPVSYVSQAITIRGIFVDEVTIICQGVPVARPIWRSMMSDSHYERLEVLTWYNDMCRTLDNARLCRTPGFGRTKQGSICMTDSFWHNLVVGLHQREEDRYALSCDDRLEYGRKCFKAFTSLLLYSVASKPGPLDLTILNQNEVQMAKIYAGQLQQAQDWSIFASRSGYLGRGPPLMKEGDRICIFFGARTPSIIRSPFTGWLTKRLPLNAYQLVGECYVEGLMRGEALLEPSWSNMGSPICLV